jgi:hypothetical protein
MSEAKLSTVQADLSTTQARLSVAQTELATLRAAYAELESTHNTLSITNSSAVVTIQLQAAEFSALHDIIAGMKLVGTMADSAHDHSLLDDIPVDTFPSSDMRSGERSLDYTWDISFALLCSEAEAAPTGSVKAHDRHLSHRPAQSANGQFALEAGEVIPLYPSPRPHALPQ